MKRGHIAWGAASAAPFAFLLLPESQSEAIVGTWAFLAFLAALVAFTLTGVLRFAHWIAGRQERSQAVERTLAEMGYANARNAKQQRRGRHGT